jgi:hypothetical protein
VSSRQPGSISRRAVLLGLCVALALAIVASLAPATMSAGLTGGNSFNELTEGQPQTTTSTQTTSTAATESGSTNNSKSVILIALGAAILVLVGIGFAIGRDARRVAPAGDAQLVEARSMRDAAARVRRRRAKAKAARLQRRRNR